MTDGAPRIGVITFPGSLDDRDAQRAVTFMGGDAVPLWHADHDLRDVDAVVLPGGFSYGDYLRCGAIARFAAVMDEVRAFAERGGPVLGICNGFQILCESGLLHGALIRNRSLRFVCRDVFLRVETSQSVVTSELTAGETVEIPVKHGEGQFVARDDELREIEDEGLVVFRYASRDGVTDDTTNPNGSIDHIAGLRNAARQRGRTDAAPRARRGSRRRFHRRSAPVRLAPRGRDRRGERVTAAEEPLHRQLGLQDDEYDRIVDTLGREPRPAELAMYGAMWSEHCSYKSSKIHLRTLPTEGPAVLVGPGQDAGAVDIGDGMAVVFKMESHSHPSAIEPYQGAATGVGGIVRDIISMGARPVALLDPLMFGPLDEERNRWLFEGVVAGIGGYGNCIGVPTVGGEIHFAEPHSQNPTVDVMCVGLARADKLATSQSLTANVGSLMVLYGAATGRDGIGGVSVLASATLDESSAASRPAVQIGDPFAEKLLIEASLELIDLGLLEGLQDLGGAGITCAVSESAARAGMGARLDLDAVPLREAGMAAFEILTSESQERMLAIVHPSRLTEVEAVCARWGLTTAVIAELVEGGGLTVTLAGETVAEVPARSLADEGPEYDRPIAAPDGERRAGVSDDPALLPFEKDLREAFFSVLTSPNVASKRWVFEQYDSIVQGQTVAGAGSDAALVRVPDTMKALALSSDGKGRYGALDPYLGALHAVAEAARNVAVTGATPLAITNCLNFGNPERPVVMWQFSESIRGIGDACRAFETPVTGGNVSFYNESADSAVWPTPVIGMLGLLADHRLRVPTGFPRPGLAVYLLGETLAELGGSEFAEAVLGVVAGQPPRLDLDREAALLRFLRTAAGETLVASGHDCGDGGIAIALAESAIEGAHGFAVTVPGDLPAHVALFSESASRAVVSVAPEHEDRLAELAAELGVPIARIGETGGPRVVFDGLFETTVDELREAYETAIPRLLGEPV